jgi:hypothetical protein
MAYNTEMASWIVHLRIAEQLMSLIPGLDEEKFALGSVAPDSGKPDERWENFTPPTRVTHFQNPDNAQRDCADLEFYRRYLHPINMTKNRKQFSFRLGYFFHLTTDNLWSLRIGRPTMKKYREQFDADRDFIWEVKKDWYGLDFIHVRDHKDCIFWRTFCKAKPEQGGLDFLVPESLAWSVRHIQKYYQTSGEETQALYNRPYIYLSQADADRFVNEAVERLERNYKRAGSNELPVEESSFTLDLTT